MQAVLQFLGTQPPKENLSLDLAAIRSQLNQLHKHLVTKEEWTKLEMIEKTEAERLGLEEYKFASNDEMLAVIEKATPQPVD